MPKTTNQEIKQRIAAVLKCLNDRGGSFDGLLEFADYLLKTCPQHFESASSLEKNRIHIIVQFINRRMIGGGLLKTEKIGGRNGRTLRILIGNRDFSPAPITAPASRTKTVDAAEIPDDEVDFDDFLGKIRLKKGVALADIKIVNDLIKEIKPFVVKLEQKFKSERIKRWKAEERIDNFSKALGESNRQRDCWKQRYEELNQQTSSIAAGSVLARVRVAGAIAAPGE